MKTFVIFLATALLLSPTHAAKKDPLVLIFTNLKNTRASIIVGVFRKQDTFTKDPYKGYKLDPKGGSSSTLFIDDLPYGEYAIAVFQDENGDGKLTTNFIGIPKEPYCFSNNFRPKVSAPKYVQCKFDYSEKSHQFYLQLI
ncbi:MAG: DUF2141 domain-containing protein [Siphonobacter sp.]